MYTDAENLSEYRAKKKWRNSSSAQIQGLIITYYKDKYKFMASFY